jgi:hypothetical protein
MSALPLKADIETTEQPVPQSAICGHASENFEALTKPI